MLGLIQICLKFIILPTFNLRFYVLISYQGLILGEEFNVL